MESEEELSPLARLVREMNDEWSLVEQWYDKHNPEDIPDNITPLELPVLLGGVIHWPHPKNVGASFRLFEMGLELPDGVTDTEFEAACNATGLEYVKDELTKYIMARYGTDDLIEIPIAFYRAIAANFV